MEGTKEATYRLETGGEGQATLILTGRLDRDSVATLWRQTTRELPELGPKELVAQVGDVVYCDAAGISLLMEYRRIQEDNQGRIVIRDLRPQFQQLMALFELDHMVSPPKSLGPVGTAIHNLGQWAAALYCDFTAQVSFTGEICVKLLKTILRPAGLRKRDTFLMAEKAGVNAMGITALLGLLIGLILAFQSAAAMEAFGAEIFVADLVAIALFRELGPLITALVLASRSGSAFAAELGTMKVNEEIDALTTMGLDPVQFLVLPRLIAAVCM